MRYLIILLLIVLLLSPPVMSCRTLFLGGCEYNSELQTYKSNIIYTNTTGVNINILPSSFGDGITTISIFKSINVIPTDPWRLTIVAAYKYIDADTYMFQNTYSNEDATPVTPLTNYYLYAGTPEYVRTPTLTNGEVFDGKWHTLINVMYEDAGTYYLKIYLDGNYIQTSTLTGDYGYTSVGATTLGAYFMIGYHNEMTYAMYSSFNGVPSDNEIKTFFTSKNIYTFREYNPFIWSTFDLEAKSYADNDIFERSPLSESISNVGSFGNGEVTKYSLSSGVSVNREDCGVRFTKKTRR